MKKYKLLITLSSITILLICSAFAFASDQKSIDDTLLQAVDEINNELDSDDIILLNAEALQLSNNVIEVGETELTEITLPIDDNRLTFSKESEDAGAYTFTVVLPHESSNELVKNNKVFNLTTDKVDHALNVVDQQVQYYVLVDENSAQTEFEYTIEMPESGFMECVDDDIFLSHFVDTDGDLMEKYIGYLSPGIALDNNGNHVETVLELDGNTVIQKVLVNENTAYPVMAGITAASVPSFYDIFNGHSWKIRRFYKERHDGSFLREDYSLSLEPKLKNNVIFVKSTPNSSWAAVVNHVPPHREWYNESRLKSQYLCHYDFDSKGPLWNLEAWRPNVNWATMVLYKCNPY